MTKKTYRFVPYSHETYLPNEMIKRSEEFLKWADKRRTIRDFSSQPIPEVVIENILKAASTAPSGAHKQPWSFHVVTDPKLKYQIRIEAEKEERESYESRMSEEWLEDLLPLGTDAQKPFLEIAPALIVVFKRPYEVIEGRKKQNYYVSESVGLACGILLMAIHHAGLAALTHTPSPMNFLAKILNKEENEKPFLLIPLGYPSPECTVPDLTRKSLKEFMKKD